MDDKKLKIFILVAVLLDAEYDPLIPREEKSLIVSHSTSNSL